MGIIYQTNKKTGITYAYENEAFWDPKNNSQEQNVGSLANWIL